MGYGTDFEGAIVVKPRLSDAFVAQFNSIAERRNNTYGDGDEVSFDHKLFGKLGRGDQTDLSANYLNPPCSGVPSCWNAWELHNSDEVDHTLIEWSGLDKFYEYISWLQLVVDFILDENEPIRSVISFEGAIKWSAGEESEDKGVMQVKKVGDRWKVELVTENDMDVCDLTYERFQSPYRGEYCNIFLPSDTQGVVRAIVEKKDEAVRPEDPFGDPACQVNAPWAYWRKMGHVASLQDLCLNKVFKLGAQAELPDHLAGLQQRARVCSGCANLFRGPAEAFVYGNLRIGYSGLSVLSRYCSLACNNAHLATLHSSIKK